jgi:putative membrane-bound dehydrogenase-like protein
MRAFQRVAPRRTDFLPRCLIVAALLCVAHAAWSADGEAPRSPLSPDDAIKAFQLDEGLKIELVAAEPDVVAPVFVAFDPKGRMWVVEMHDYPNGPAPGEPGKSRIRVLTDDNHDGRFTDPVTFADQLLFANTLMFWKDGVLVTTDGKLDFFADRDGDGRAEFRETWFTGFARENPQLRCNHPTLGLDGWIYVANGLRGGKVVSARPDWPKREPIDLGARDFRFNPETGVAETTSGFGQYGMSFDDYGRRFLCSNRNPCMHAVLPESALRRNPDVAVTAVIADVCAAAENSRIYPISRFWTTSNLHEGQFTAACGLKIYRGSALPAEFYGNAFTCDPTGNLIHREMLAPAAATFRGRSPYDGREFLATRDTWFRPVDTTVGPDGALYVVDMHRAVIEHPEYVPDELKARPDLMLGIDRGRIYRVVPAGSTTTHQPAAVDQATPSLVALLDHPNVWQRETAFRLLVERRDPSAIEPLRRLSAGEATPAGTTNALWALASIGALTADDVLKTLEATDPNVVEQGLELTELHFAKDRRLAEQACALAKRELAPRLRFRLALALGGIAPNPDLPATLARLLAQGVDDPWLATAVAISSGEQISATASAFLETISSREPAEIMACLPAAGRLIEVVGVRRQASEFATTVRSVENVAASLRPESLSWRSRLWQRLAAGARMRGGAPVSQLIAAATEGNLPVDRVIREVAAAAIDETKSSEVRCDAIRLLEFGEFAVVSMPLKRCLDSTDLTVAAAATTTLARHSERDVATILIADIGSRSPVLRREILGALLTSDVRIKALLDAIDVGQIAAAELDPVRMQQLLRVQNPELKPRIAALAAANVPADRSEVLAKYQAALARSGDPKHGRELFAKNCTQCHKIGELGVNVAPDISDSRVKLPSQLLTDILDPNRAIDNNYFNYAIVDRDGVVHTGVISAETATSITLRQPENKQVTLRRDAIEQVKSLGVSLMPVGLEKDLSVGDMSDLISFIKNWRYLDGSVPKEVIR